MPPPPPEGAGGGMPPQGEAPPPEEEERSEGPREPAPPAAVPPVDAADAEDILIEPNLDRAVSRGTRPSSTQTDFHPYAGRHWAKKNLNYRERSHMILYSTAIAALPTQFLVNSIGLQTFLNELTQHSLIIHPAAFGCS